MIAVTNAQYNVPLPKACGALWSHNGLLVCFFPSKPERKSSLLELSFKASDRSSRNRRTMFEGFGRIQNVPSRQKRHASTLETIESGDSEFDDASTSSSASSSPSSDIGLPQHHFMPSIAFRGDKHEGQPSASLDESQKSSSDSRLRRSKTSTAGIFVSVHDLSELLPAKQYLAQGYNIGKASVGSVQNSHFAGKRENVDLADIWSLIGLLLQDKVPLEVVRHPRDEDFIFIVARRAGSTLRARDSAIDLSSDDSQEQSSLPKPAAIKWGYHPFGRRSLVKSL